MPLSVNHEDAMNALIEAINSPRDEIVENAISVEDMNLIFHGSHKTFKYMFLTALLSKHVNNNINALSLQAKWDDPGAYDARNVCHKSIVPIEESHLGLRLGASPEPFVNNPARNKCISLKNKVRSGNDRSLLEHMVRCLTKLNGLSPEAITHSLYNAVTSILELESRIPTHVIVENSSISSEKVVKLFSDILETSCEGQSCVVVFGAIMKLIHGIDSVKCHPVNQAGSSSNEIGDVDFFDDGVISHCAELKDKKYETSHKNHAIRKATNGGCRRIMFVHGPNGQYSQNGDEEHSNLDVISFNLSEEWIRNNIQTFSEQRLKHLIACLFETVDEIRGKDDIRQHIEAKMEDAGIEIHRL